MPNRKFLDKKSVEGYRKVLLDLKEKIAKDLKQIKDDTAKSHKDSSSDSGHALHMADVATDMYDREFSLGLASNDRELLFKVDEALKRINENTFGMCRECEKPIAPARLKAIPYVQTCMKCQEALESKR